MYARKRSLQPSTSLHPNFNLILLFRDLLFRDYQLKLLKNIRERLETKIPKELNKLIKQGSDLGI